ncbi:hypothetical protein [Legionella sp. PC997]|uniref:hypothetical protein n=1 Tax=Legionella sp. PC997 TaxID=2755562 RepID=UPI0015F7F835|nr:hypothetical protein [Legionella sp. PC997]
MNELVTEFTKINLRIKPFIENATNPFDNYLDAWNNRACFAAILIPSLLCNTQEKYNITLLIE